MITATGNHGIAYSIQYIKHNWRILITLIFVKTFFNIWDVWEFLTL